MNTCGDIGGKPCEFFEKDPCPVRRFVGSAPCFMSASYPACAPMVEVEKCRFELGWRREESRIYDTVGAPMLDGLIQDLRAEVERLRCVQRAALDWSTCGAPSIPGIPGPFDVATAILRGRGQFGDEFDGKPVK